ncbi:MAG: DUF6531 domain-containing protein [Candidatus Omnitrophica bacterium]|nr:DUF6531 domain-containing protein [Candidatus Omnitrophota bacterium]MDD5552307.1 DUF6531 domain-containing protein [Candidatus Omnitrophota bacterium]
MSEIKAKEIRTKLRVIFMTLFFCLFSKLAFAETTASISVSGSRGVIDISTSTFFSVDPDTGRTGGTVAIYRDSSKIYEASTTKYPSWAYSFRYSTIEFIDGSHTFSVVATSWDGSSASDSQAIQTDNSPRINIISPQGETRGVVDVNISYSYPSSHNTSPNMYLDLYTNPANPNPSYTMYLALSNTAETQGNWILKIDTTAWRDGARTIRAVTRNIRNAVTATSDVVSNNTPYVILSPGDGKITRGIIPVNVTYSFPSTASAVGIPNAYLTFYIDNVAKSAYWFALSDTSETTGIWSFNIDTSNWAEGSAHTLKITTLTHPNQAIMVSNVIVAKKTTEVPLTRLLSKDKGTVVGEPINVATGNMFTSQTDILIPGREIPLELSRTYNSQDDFGGQFGYGWRSNFDIVLTDESDRVIEVDETGVYTIYDKDSDGTYKPSAGKYSVLTKNPEGTYTILRKSGRKLYFDSQGWLIKIGGRNGNFINILRDSNGTITEISDASTRKLLFTADSQGRIVRVTDQQERTFKYEYDTNGDLIKTIDPLNQETLYQYDSNHNLIRQTDANSHSLYFEYDSSDRAYHSWQDEHNNEVTLSFDPENKTTITTDSLGNATKYEYDDYGLVTKITDSQNKVQSFIWDSDLNKTASTDQNGNTALFTYDSRGNLLTVKDPLNNTAAFTYEPDFDLVSSITDALGAVTQYTYDARGNLIKIKDALDNATDCIYNVQGDLIQLKDANNNITNFTYDAFGNLAQAVDALNNPTSFTYDILGNLVRTTDAVGNATQFTYDALNRLIRITYPDNSQAARAYDPVGNLITSTDPNNQITSYAYDTVNRLIQVTDPQGNITQCAYDSEGNRTSAVDAAGNVQRYFYDSLNRPIRTLDALNNQANFVYDPAGNLISRTDANGNTINYTYDSLNRLLKKQYPDSTEEAFDYDPRGNMLSCSDPEISYNLSYDALGRLIDLTDSNNAKLSYAYDPVGNKIKTTTPEDRTISYYYDGLNQLASLVDIYGKSTTYTYDSLGRRIKTTLPNSTTASYTYDALSRLLSLTNKTSSGAIISSYTYTYDSVGNRLTRVEPHLKTSYAYDDLYQLTQSSFTRLKGHKSDIEEDLEEDDDEDDDEEEKDSRKEPKERLTEAYTYDVLGNRLTSLKDTYTYNPLNQLLATDKYAYEYDHNGNLIRKTELDENEAPVTFNYEYDYENRLKQVRIEKEDESKIISFGYDPFGRRIRKTIQKEDKTETTTYIYDNEDIILEYRRDGSKPSKQEVVRYTHGPGTDEPISMERKKKRFYYHYDGLGSVTEFTSQKQKTAERYEYDSFGNLYRQGNRTKNTYTFTGREFDKETGLYYYRNRYYDPKVGRFITQDPLGMVDGPNMYAYVRNNPITFVDPWGWCKKTGWWPRWLNLIVPGYRNYGGPSRSGPLLPEDLLDAAFQRHDIGYREGNLDFADLQLLNDLSNLPPDPRNWGEGVNPIYARLYRKSAFIIFATRQTIRQGTKELERLEYLAV